MRDANVLRFVNNREIKWRVFIFPYCRRQLGGTFLTA